MLHHATQHKAHGVMVLSASYADGPGFKSRCVHERVCGRVHIVHLECTNTSLFHFRTQARARMHTIMCVNMRPCARPQHYRSLLNRISWKRNLLAARCVERSNPLLHVCARLRIWKEHASANARSFLARFCPHVQTHVCTSRHARACARAHTCYPGRESNPGHPRDRRKD